MVFKLEFTVGREKANKLKGVHIGIPYIEKEEISGVQAGLFNESEIFYGIQIGGINRCECGYGVQVGVLQGTITGDKKDLEFTGVQVGIINANIDSFSGLQAGAINLNGNAKGAQIGIYNYNEDNFKGVQVGAVNHQDNNSKLDGVQVGIYCSADKGNYFQIGLITRRKDEHGFIKGWSPFVGWNTEKQKETQKATRDEKESALEETVKQ